MRWFFSKIIYMVIIAVAAAVGVYLFLSANADGSAEPFADTVMVELGDITKSLDVTGKLEAKEVTRLGFGVPGVIQQIYKTEGDFVEAKEVIASLISASVIAEYDAAYKNAEFFRQAKQEIIDGVTREERQRIDAAVTLAKAQRNSIKDTYTQLISNAKQNLLSSGLEAYPLSMQNDNVPPTVSGNYTCEAEGVYRLKIFN
jgi:multidrug efflux pump subunit AcrA (membrane-fusion protein)